MQTKKSVDINSELMSKIINVAYNDAGFIESISVYWKTFFNKDVKRLLDEYKITAQSVHKIKEEKLSAGIIESINSRINSQKSNDNLASKFYHGLLFIFSKPGYSYSIAGLSVLTISALLIFNEPSQSPKYTKAEIEIAQKQLGETLAIVNKVFKNTREQLDKKVLNNHVTKPINKGLNFINDLITGG